MAGAFLLLIGLSEFRQIWGLPFLLWTRLFLPVGLLGAGVSLLIWSDHEAWPIGVRELNMAGRGFGGRETSYSSRDPIFAWASWGVIPEMTKARVRDLK